MFPLTGDLSAFISQIHRLPRWISSVSFFVFTDFLLRHPQLRMASALFCLFAVVFAVGLFVVVFELCLFVVPLSEFLCLSLSLFLRVVSTVTTGYVHTMGFLFFSLPIDALYLFMVLSYCGCSWHLPPWILRYCCCSW